VKRINCEVDANDARRIQTEVGALFGKFVVNEGQARNASHGIGPHRDCFVPASELPNRFALFPSRTHMLTPCVAPTPAPTRTAPPTLQPRGLLPHREPATARQALLWLQRIWTKESC
jgi:hypothetical protein